MSEPQNPNYDDKRRVVEAVYREMPQSMKKKYSLEQFERDFAKAIIPLIRSGEIGTYWLNKGEDRYARDAKEVREREAERLEKIVNKK
ncbi:MAG: hypothetical protein AABW79_01430 [Nanoarchaeota archaeon]